MSATALFVIMGLIGIFLGVIFLGSSKIRSWANLAGVIPLALGGFSLISALPSSGVIGDVRAGLMVIMLVITIVTLTAIGNKILTIVAMIALLLMLVAGYYKLPPADQAAIRTVVSTGAGGLVHAFRSVFGSLPGL